MADPREPGTRVLGGAIAERIEGLGAAVLRWVAEWGYYGALLVESVYWIAFGHFRRQPVRLSAVFSQMMTIGIAAVPIVTTLSFSVGVMLGIQGIHTLRTFGAESQVVIPIALAVTREFGPLITAIVVAGRTGSALAARIGTMQVSQEIDALSVMSINATRYLVAPVLAAMVVMLPMLTFVADVAGLAGGAAYSALELGLSPEAYLNRTADVVTADDILQGFYKSLVFAVIVAVVGVSNGFTVTGGAEGVGRATTRSVVVSISYIVVADMVFTWFLNLGQ